MYAHNDLYDQGRKLPSIDGVIYFGVMIAALVVVVLAVKVLSIMF